MFDSTVNMFLTSLLLGGISELLLAIFFMHESKKEKYVDKPKTGKSLKILSIILIISGLMIIIPISLMGIVKVVTNRKEAKNIEKLSNKVYVTEKEIDTDFTYKGKKLVILDEDDGIGEMYDVEDVEAETVANLVVKTKNYYATLKKLKNDSGHDIFLRGSYDYLVYENEKDEIIDFYKKDSDYKYEYDLNNSGSYTSIELDNKAYYEIKESVMATADAEVDESEKGEETKDSETSENGKNSENRLGNADENSDLEDFGSFYSVQLTRYSKDKLFSDEIEIIIYKEDSYAVAEDEDGSRIYVKVSDENDKKIRKAVKEEEAFFGED
ncbi:MAG: hypothetical protein K6D02_02890 [Lachnospiraceae bacterium]|nr:hypothetical protein [Lachnospiraceae bacterium]